jgi:hypothetical protein
VRLFSRKCVNHHKAAIHCIGLLVFGCCDIDIDIDIEHVLVFIFEIVRHSFCMSVFKVLYVWCWYGGLDYVSRFLFAYSLEGGACLLVLVWCTGLCLSILFYYGPECVTCVLGTGWHLLIPVVINQRVRRACWYFHGGLDCVSQSLCLWPRGLCRRATASMGDWVVSRSIIVYSPESGTGLLIVYAPESGTGLKLVLVLAGHDFFLVFNLRTGALFRMRIRILDLYSIQMGILWIFRVSDFF